MALHVQAIPSSEEVRETLLDRIYYPYKKQILIGGTILGLAILGVLAVRQVRERRLDDQWTRFDAARSVAATGDDADPDREVKAAERRADLFRRLIEDYPDDPVTQFAMTEQVRAYVQAKRYEDALKALEALRARFPGSLLFTESADASAAGTPRTLAERMETNLRAEKEWAAATVYKHPEPSTKHRAYVETTLGNFWLGFYEEQAPEHVAAFLANAKAGWFNCTQVYHVRTGGQPEAPTPMLFEAGSAASKFGDPEFRPNPAEHDWDEPTAVMDHEDSRFSIKHLRGVVTTVEMTSGESARRFAVVAAEKGHAPYDGRHTPFAAVLEAEDSMATVARISKAATYGTDPATRDNMEPGWRDHPYPPIWIRRVTIWSPDNKIEGGHTWDTSRAGKPEPEPWEAQLPAPPKPGESVVTPPTPGKEDEKK